MGPGDIRVRWAAVPPGRPRRDTAWELLRELAPRASLSNPCPFCGGPHGPVRLAGAPLLAAVTYAGGFAVAAMVDTQHASAFGIDAEPVADERRDAAGLTGVLGRGAASPRSWTRVEAVLKADGRGVRVDPAAVRIEVGTAVETASWTATVPGTDGRYLGWDLAGPDGVLLSAAIRARAAPPVMPAAADGRATR